MTRHARATESAGPARASVGFAIVYDLSARIVDVPGFVDHSPPIELELTMPATTPDDEELRERLSPAQYAVTQGSSTEQPFTGEYWDCHDDGTYHCVVCDTALFTSDTKFESGSGWPSFFDTVGPELVEIRTDTTHAMMREEAVCASCGAHLGHRFADGPAPTGQRYCMNSASLRLERDS